MMYKHYLKAIKGAEQAIKQKLRGETKQKALKMMKEFKSIPDTQVKLALTSTKAQYARDYQDNKLSAEELKHNTVIVDLFLENYNYKQEE